MIDEYFCHLKAVCIFVGTGVRRAVIEGKDLGSGETKQDRRVAGNEKLGAALGAAVDLHKERKLPLGRQGCLRLIEQIDPVFPEGVLSQREEAFAVGSLVEMLRDAAGTPAVFIFHGGYIIETLRPEEIAVDRPAGAAGEADRVTQFRVGVVG